MQQETLREPKVVVAAPISPAVRYSPSANSPHMASQSQLSPYGVRPDHAREDMTAAIHSVPKVPQIVERVVEVPVPMHQVFPRPDVPIGVVNSDTLQVREHRVLGANQESVVVQPNLPEALMRPAIHSIPSIIRGERVDEEVQERPVVRLESAVSISSPSTSAWTVSPAHVQGLSPLSHSDTGSLQNHIDGVPWQVQGMPSTYPVRRIVIPLSPQSSTGEGSLPREQFVCLQKSSPTFPNPGAGPQGSMTARSDLSSICAQAEAKIKALRRKLQEGQMTKEAFVAAVCAL